MAKALLALRGRRSLFQGLSKDAVIGAWASLPVATELRNGLSDSFDQAVKAGLKGVDSEEDKKLITRLAELTKSSLYAPEIDLGFAIQEKSPVRQAPRTS